MTKTTTRKPRTNPDRDAANAALLDELDDHVSALRTSDGWLAYLDMASKFHNYSLHNLLLIAMQRPDATRCAGYKTWQALGRQVRKGERGIGILAPKIKRFEVEDRDTGETTTRRALYGFRVVRVFDVAQTDGDDLPKDAATMWREAADVDTRGTAAHLDAMYDAIRSLGFTVKVHDASPDGSLGWWNIGTKVLNVVERDPGAMAKTLAHELAHALDEHVAEDRAMAEVVAESVAYIVGRTLGLDPEAISPESAIYLAAWSKDDDAIPQTAARVLTIARTILDAAFGVFANVEATDTNTDQEEAA